MKPLTMTPGREAFWRTLADAPDATLSPIAEFEAGIAREFLLVIDALRAERDAALAMVERLVAAHDALFGTARVSESRAWEFKRLMEEARALLAKQKEG